MSRHIRRTDRRTLIKAAAAGTMAAPLLGTAARGALAQDTTPEAGTMAPNPDISGSIQVGMVGNPQMVALQDIIEAGEFAKLYPNIEVNLTVLPENEIRQTIERDVASQS